MGVSKGTYANRPSSHAAGDIYLTTDSFWDYLVSDGSQWLHLFAGFQCIPPNDGEFYWENQGAASVSTLNGGIFMRVPARAGIHPVYRLKTAPAAPYVLTAGILPLLAGAVDPFTEIQLKESATAKFLSIRFQSHYYMPLTAAEIAVGSHSGYLLHLRLDAMPSHSLIWLRLEDDGADVKASFSGDGQNFVQVYSAVRASIFTSAPDRLGWGVDANNANYDAGSTLIHWSLPGAVKSYGFWGRSVGGIGQMQGNCVGVFG